MKKLRQKDSRFKRFKDSKDFFFFLEKKGHTKTKRLKHARAYFRIQGKHPAYSKRASYHGNTNWPDSPNLIKVLVTIGLNRLSSLHMPSWHISIFTDSYFLSEILRIPDNGRNRNLLLCFSRISRRYYH